jgi:flagellar basal body-associated protein FliL
MAKRKDNPDNEGENLNEGNNGDDNFGLPDLDYKPLDSTEETSKESTPTDFTSDVNTENENQNSEQEEREKNYSYTPTEEPKSNAPVIIAIIIGLVLVVAGYLIYQYWYIPKGEKAKKELAKQLADKKNKDEQARLAKEKEDADRRRAEEEKAAAAIAQPAEGTIETLNERTGRYYVVVSSDIDDDLIMDFAKKLSKEGTSVRIIPPYGKWKFYRLTIGNYDSFAEAQTNADGAKANYGDGVWVIKY